MNGQWVSRITFFDQPATLVIDIDRNATGAGFNGEASAWFDTSPGYFLSTNIFSSTNDNKQSFDLEILPYDFNGLQFTEEQIAEIAKKHPVPIQKRVTFEWNEASLLLSWVADDGQIRTLSLHKSSAGEKSEIRSLVVRSWSAFKEYVGSLERGRYVFRGHQSNKWRLRTSYHRTGRANMTRYVNLDINILWKNISALTRHVFDLSKPLEYGAFVSLAQHHGFPTPLLDWTRSPYVAAFFAYRGLSANEVSKSKDKVRIYLFDIEEWQKLPRFINLAKSQRHLSILDALAIENSRMIPQQALSTMTNVDDIETYIQDSGKFTGVNYLQAIDMPVTWRHEVMHELAMMGITAASMFPGLDGACEELKERLFR